ncbi:MAG: proline dehydrogenase family protein [Chloroflexi bacterium]|nr:proline dehydrogenase family protein [Chloroflexota bacterium]
MSRVRRAIGGVVERAMRAVLLWLSRRRAIGRFAKWMPLSRPIVARFVAGETLESALPVIDRLRAAGFRTSVDILGEAVTEAAAARTAAAGYVAAIPALAAAGLDVNVSIKLSQMGLGLGPELVRENVARILTAASAAEGFVRIDMEDHTTTDATLALVRELRPLMAGSGDVGVVLQSALRRTPADAEALITEGIRVRLCKGAYREPASVAYPDKPDVDAAYVAVMKRLLDDGTFPAIATHDDRIVEGAIAYARERGIRPERFEFQMLFGVRRDLQERLVREGWGVRVYVPTGSQWYPYFMRRLAERPANVVFLAVSVLRERRAGR